MGVGDESGNAGVGEADHKAAFSEWMAGLVGRTFDSYGDAVIEINRIGQQTGYTLGYHDRRGNVEKYRCERWRETKDACPVRLAIQFSKSSSKVTFNVNSERCTHSHAPNARARMTAKVKYEYMDRIKNEMETHKLTRYDAYNRVNPAMRKIYDCNYNTRNITRLFRGEERRAEAAQLAADAEGAAMVYEAAGGDVEIVDTELTEHEFNGICNELRCLQYEDPNAYIVVQHENLNVEYFFISLGWMRDQGRLFGERKVTDDKHGMSERGYHLGTLGIPNNHGALVPIALAGFSSASTKNWKQFIEDCVKAFAPVADGFSRAWSLTTADQAVPIRSAFDMVMTSGGHELEACFKHFVRLLEDRHASHTPFWRPITDKLQSLINSWKWWESERLEREIHDDIEDLPDEFVSLNTKLGDFFRCAKGRVLHKRECFTYGWNSQSGAEAIFAITSHLKIGKDKSLLCCVQRLISLCRNIGVRAQIRPTPPVVNHQELSKTAARLTNYAYDMFFDEYTSLAEYEAEDVGDGIFRVRKMTDTHNHYHVIDSNTWKCCCNYRVWMGMACRHLILVWLKVHKRYMHDDVLFSSRWFRNQPPSAFMYSSPSVPRDVSATAAAVVRTSAATTTGVVGGAGSRDCGVPVASLPPLLITRSQGDVVISNPVDHRADIHSQFSAVVDSIGNNSKMLSVVSSFVSAMKAATVADTAQSTQPQLQHLIPSTGRPPIKRKQGTGERIRTGEKLKLGAKKTGKPPVRCSRCRQTGHIKTKCPQDMQRKRNEWLRRIEKKQQVVVCVEGNAMK
eukprot:GHVU01155359.1.p1 GENE.GHVU01155359.1~~GHVU01155359.1.p1  ORF type:complete len:794 (+),score=61.76 GHVU01155359.1:475-2856(+)